MVFIEALATELLTNGTGPQDNETKLAVMERVDADLNLTNTLDPECKQRWFPLGIKLNYTNTTEPAHKFISSMGRMKYLNPIYRALLETDQRDLAVSWFCENKGFYHPLAIAALKKLLSLTDEEFACTPAPPPPSEEELLFIK